MTPHLFAFLALFGIGKKKDKAASAFEEAQARATKSGGGKGSRKVAPQQAAGSANAGKAAAAVAAGGGDMEALLSELTSGMSTDELSQLDDLMAQMGDVDMEGALAGMADAFSAMADMDPDELVKQVQDAVNTPEIQEMLKNPEQLLEGMRGTGFIDDSLIDDYVGNPRKYRREIKKITDELMSVLNDPSAMKDIIKMMSGVGDLLSDPAAMEAAMLEIADEFEKWESDMTDTDKLEAARVEMLANPDLASNPALAGVFNTKEMQDILNDPEKWAETVQEGQRKMRKGADAAEL